MKLGLHIASAALVLMLAACGGGDNKPAGLTTNPFLPGSGTNPLGLCTPVSGTPIDTTVQYHSATLSTYSYPPTSVQNSVVLSIVSPSAYYPGQFNHQIAAQGTFYFSDLAQIAYQANILPSSTSPCVSTTQLGSLTDYNPQVKGISLVLQGAVTGTRTTPVVYPMIYPSPVPTTPTTETVNLLVTLNFSNSYLDRSRPGKILGSATVNVSVQSANGMIQNLPARGYSAQ